MLADMTSQGSLLLTTERDYAGISCMHKLCIRMEKMTHLT